MSQPLSVALITARTLLNDDGASLWPDSVLIPKAQQAHRELQQKLRKFSAPVMRTITGSLAGGRNDLTVLNNTTSPSSLPSDLIEPIKLWEKPNGASDSAYTLMTEVDPIQNTFSSGVGVGVPMNYWFWTNLINVGTGFAVNNIVVPFPADIRQVRVYYWRSLGIPQVNTDPIGIDNGEIWMAPRIAALAAGSIGEEKIFAAMTALAEQTLADVISMNRGRSAPSFGSAIRP